MALDSKWISIPLPVTQTRDKAQSNLAPHEARTLFDIDVEQSRGSWTMRRGHKLVMGYPSPSIRNVRALSEYTRDGVPRIAALLASNGNDNEIIYPWDRRSDALENWDFIQTTPGTFDNIGKVGLETKTNELRVFGPTLIWHGNVRAQDYRRFDDLSAIPVANPVTDVNDFNTDLSGITLIPWNPQTVPPGWGYAGGRYVWYAASLMYESGQESPLGAITSPMLTVGSGGRFTVHIHVPDIRRFSKRVKAIRLYSAQNRDMAGNPLTAQSFFLVREIGIYDLIGERQHNAKTGWLNLAMQVGPGHVLVGSGGANWYHHSEDNVQLGTRLVFSWPNEVDVMDESLIVNVTRVSEENTFLRLDFDPSQQALVNEMAQFTAPPRGPRRRERSDRSRGTIRLWHRWSIFTNAIDPEYQDANIFIEDGGQSLVKRYYDYSLVPQVIRDISPPRRRGRIFADRAFYWGVTDDTGTETFNRLYYSHFNGNGIHCPDIVLPANYVDFPFDIMGLVEAGTHRIIVGDIGYAVGYMRGSVKDQWQIYQGNTRVGCISEKSIAETPFGAVFLGYDGIYIVASLQYQGPYGLGIFREIETHPNLTKAIGGYSQQGMRYYLYIPGVVVEHGGGQKTKTVPSKFYCIDLNSEDKRVRELSAPDLDDIHIFGFGLDGTALFATEDGIFRSEELPGETDFLGTPKPEVETGFIRILQGDKHQQITAIALDYVFVTFLEGAKIQLTVTGYQNGIETTVSLPPSTGGKLQVFKLPVPKDLAHSIRLRTVDDAGHTVHPTKFTVNAIQVLTGEADGTL